MSREIMETTGQRFKKIRKELRFSQEDFGKNVGLSKSAISAVENNKSFISLDIMRKLVIDFKINLNWLVSGYGEMFIDKINQEELTVKVENILKKNGLI